MLNKANQGPLRVERDEKPSEQFPYPLEPQDLFFTHQMKSLIKEFHEKYFREFLNSISKRKKLEKTRSANSKSKSKLRKSKVLYTDAGIESSHPQSTRYWANLCSVSVNLNLSSGVGVSPLSKTVLALS